MPVLTVTNSLAHSVQTPMMYFSQQMSIMHSSFCSTSVDASQLAAAQEDGPFKIWLVSPCSIVLVRWISSTSVDASSLPPL
ncbi:hypothetical protein MRB53_016599 [Persea americana]|uniref:Uncharacterized protein n=1 Tax=Persea americana TaxID=3435 RepID=A0ACC2M2Q1_PERAE|nr:hypothetical protein MRB53_016599 [Persea americana]